MSLSLSQTLSAPSPASNEDFGSGVAVTEDGTRMVVGAKGESTTGRVHVYLLDGGDWTFEQTLNRTGSGGLEFGSAAAINAGGDRITVGSSATGTSSDRVFVYSRSGTTWSLQQTITPATTGKSFGAALAMSNDGETLLVGSPSFDYPQTNAGNVISYTWNSSLTRYDIGATIFAGTGVDQDVGTRGTFDINGDGTRAVIGQRANFVSTGRVMFLKLTSAGAVDAQIAVSVSGSNIGDEFGIGVSINNDGDAVLVAQQGSGGTNQGSVSLYTRSGDTWTFRQEFTPTDAADDKRFSMPVISGDGQTAYVANKAGQVYMFTRSGNTFTQASDTTYLPSSLTSDENVVLSTTETGTALVIGSETISSNQGRAYTYSVTNTTTVQGAALPDGQVIAHPTNYFFWDASGETTTASGMTVTPSGGSTLPESSMRTWGLQGSGRCGGYVLGGSTQIAFDTPLTGVGSFAFYLGVDTASYASGTVTVDLSANDVSIASYTGSVGEYDVSITSDSVTVTYPASAPSQVLWINLAFASDNTTLSAPIPVTYA